MNAVKELCFEIVNISDCTSNSGYVCFSPGNSHNKECFNKIKRNHVLITSYIKTGFLCDLMTTIFYINVTVCLL